MEEKVEYKVHRYYPEEEPTPPSRIVIEFAGPGSATLSRLDLEGLVSVNQLAVAGAILSHRAEQEWALPMIEMVARKTIETFLGEVMAPKVARPGGPGPPFFVPPDFPGKPV